MFNVLSTKSFGLLESNKQTAGVPVNYHKNKNKKFWKKKIYFLIMWS